MDAAFETFSAIAKEARAKHNKIISEEDTKIKIITRILTECLGWSFTDIAAETAHEPRTTVEPRLDTGHARAKSGAPELHSLPASLAAGTSISRPDFTS